MIRKHLKVKVKLKMEKINLKSSIHLKRIRTLSKTQINLILPTSAKLNKEPFLKLLDFRLIMMITFGEYMADKFS